MKKQMRRGIAAALVLIAVCNLSMGSFTAQEVTGISESTEDAQSNKSEYLENLTYTDWARYTGNEGDSFINKIGTRCGNQSIAGITYDHGMEIWLARWNFCNEASWVWKKYSLEGLSAKYLTATLSFLAGSYNRTNFNTTFELYGDDTLLCSYVVTPSTTSIPIHVRIAGYSTLTVKAYDNTAVSGGTSLCLGDAKIISYENKVSDSLILQGDADDLAGSVGTMVSHEIENGLSEISMGDINIDGPTVSFWDKSVPLFTLSGSVDLDFSKMNMQIKYDTTTKTVKVLLGLKEAGNADIVDSNDVNNAEWAKEYKQVKDLYESMTIFRAKGSSFGKNNYARFEQMKSELNDLQCNMFVSASMNAVGYLEFSYETGKLKLSEGGVITGIHVATELKSRPASCPVIYTAMKLSGDLNASMKAVYENAFCFDYTVEPSLTAGITLGAGTNAGRAATYIEGSIDATLAMKLTNQSTPAFSVYMTGNLYLKGELLGHEYLDQEIPYLDTQLYPQQDQSVTEQSQALDATGSLNTSEVISRNYLGSQMDLPYDGILKKDGVYPYNEVKYVSLPDGRKMMLWLGDNGTKSELNRTTLMYSIYDGTSWTQEAPVFEDGTYAQGISTCQKDGDTYIIFQKAENVFADDTELSGMLDDFDLYQVKFDGNSFTAPECITGTDNAVYETGGLLCTSGDGLAAAWIENSENDVFQANGTNSVCMKTKADDGTWSDRSVVYETGSMIRQICMGESQGQTLLYFVVYSEDAGDSLYLCQGGQVGQLISGESIENMQCVNGILYFLLNGTVYTYDGTYIVSTGVEYVNSFQIVENGNQKAIIGTISNVLSPELYVSRNEGGIWNSFEPYTDLDSFLRDYQAVMEEDGTVTTAINAVDMEAGTAAILVTGQKDQCDLSIDQVYYKEDEVKEGGDLPVSFLLHNESGQTLNDLQIQLTNQNGDVLLSKTQTCQIEAQQTGQLTIDYNIPKGFQGMDVTLTVTAENMQESDLENNAYTFYLGYADLGLGSIAVLKTGDDSAVYEGSIYNTGYTDAGNVILTICDSDGIILTQKSYPVMRADTSEKFCIPVPEELLDKKVAGTLNAAYFSVASDTEEQVLSNNDEKLIYGEADLLPTYQIYFDGNQKTSGSMEIMQNCRMDQSYTLVKNGFSRNGYQFTGWNTKADGTGSAYKDTASVRELTDKTGTTVVLYAQWQPLTYSISYYLNGGKNAAGNVGRYTIQDSVSLKNPSFTGYQFAGWYTDKACTKKITSVAKGTCGNIAVYAKWKPNQYNIHYLGNGSSKGKMTDTKNKSYGSQVQLKKNQFKRTGYTFTGWNTKANGSGKSYKNTEKVKNLTSKDQSTVKMYAQWKKIKYHIVYKTNKGRNNKHNPSVYDVTTGTIKLKSPTRSGYKFAGWYSDKKFKKKVLKIKKGSIGNTVLYAKWIKK